ncbi:MAG: hypothetical protein EOP34_07555 [Rickettsiales bacterium]|nr:MAG: hypothetical protein EOP34_07555 [Rickettsiales bacterium]
MINILLLITHNMDYKIEKNPDTLGREVTRRNFLMRRFFTENNVSITLMGDYNSPLIVMEDNVVLSCYAHNFELIFKDDTHNGNELFRIRLKNNPEQIKNKLSKWVEEAKHRKVYLFKARGFYFAKYVKVFNDQSALYTPKKGLAYYVFNRQKAIEIKEKLKKEEPTVEIVY